MTYAADPAAISTVPLDGRGVGANVSPDGIRWRVHPFCDNRGRTVLLVGLLMLVLVGVRLSYPEPVWTLLAALLLFGSLARYFFPTSYRLGEEGLEVSFLGWRKRWPWSYFRSYSVGRTGVLLSPFPRAHRLEGFRGHYLLFGSRREEVIDFVRAHVSSNTTAMAED